MVDPKDIGQGGFNTNGVLSIRPHAIVAENGGIVWSIVYSRF